MQSLKNLQPDNWDIELNDNLYQAQISRNNPTAILFLIDQSGSMSLKTSFQGQQKTYAQVVAELINQMLNELIGRCTKAEGVRDYFDICVIGYGGKDSLKSNVLWEGNLAGKEWVSVSELKENATYEQKTVTKNIRSKTKTVKETIPFWFRPKSNFQTPMGAAFEHAYNLLKNWILDSDHKSSYPPVVINITDGAQSDTTDQEMINKAKKIKSLNTKDGFTLVLNCHISSDQNSVVFPLSTDELPDSVYAGLLFEMSSVMPLIFDQQISLFRNDPDILSAYKGMAFNAGMDVLFNLIDIGTSGSTQQLINK